MERENHPLPGFPSGDKPDSNFSLTPFYKPSLLGKSGAFSFTLSLRPSPRGENLCVSVGWGGASLEQVRECRKDTGSHPGKPPCEPFEFIMFISLLGTKNDPSKGTKSNVPRRFGNCGRPAPSRTAVPVGRPEGTHAARWTQATPGVRAARPGQTAPRTPCEGSPHPAVSGDSRLSTAAEAKLVRGFRRGCALRNRLA